MMNIKFLNLFGLIAGILLLVGCSKDNEENGIDDTTVSNKEIIIKITIYSEGNRYSGVDLELDGNWVKDQIVHYNEAYTLYLTNLESLPFPDELIVDWGDGTTSNSTSHEYTQSGTYQITLKCKRLRSLYIKADLTDLDISQAVDLEYLILEEIRGNRKLKTLDVSRNKKLKVLDYSEIDVPFVDVTNNSQLMYLDCSDQGFEEYPTLDFSKNTALRYLNCSWSGLKSLDIKECKELIYLDASDCGLSDEVANKIYSDLPQGKTWKTDEDDNNSYSSTVRIGYYDRYGDYQWHNKGNTSIATKKGWQTHYSY